MTELIPFSEQLDSGFEELLYGVQVYIGNSGAN